MIDYTCMNVCLSFGMTQTKAKTVVLVTLKLYLYYFYTYSKYAVLYRCSQYVIRIYYQTYKYHNQLYGYWNNLASADGISVLNYIINLLMELYCTLVSICKHLLSQSDWPSIIPLSTLNFAQTLIIISMSVPNGSNSYMVCNQVPTSFRLSKWQHFTSHFKSFSLIILRRVTNWHTPGYS